MTAATYRKKPTTVQAIQWTGDNIAELREFAGAFHFDTIDPAHRGDNPDHDAQVHDELHGRWIPFGPGDWVIRGIQGELYPCKGDVFAETYEVAS